MHNFTRALLGEPNKIICWSYQWEINFLHPKFWNKAVIVQLSTWYCHLWISDVQWIHQHVLFTFDVGIIVVSVPLFRWMRCCTKSLLFKVVHVGITYDSRYWGAHCYTKEYVQFNQSLSKLLTSWGSVMFCYSECCQLLNICEPLTDLYWPIHWCTGHSVN